ncbi:acyl-CoA carboxylase subunit epsilon [Nocardiopsis alborubida]|uniref:Acyl-CoA carboxylase subunit epsilon n=1 Tax=Nocardiopsis alborubida TaxID=146802 RepID=A0A7X6MAU2_9ACTN|nr:acyl-CoA carboxylase subunit epsilon [Nocardiopsis alborubida]NKY97174.1 acyl-CoA carboxylase subunit epsilon [Nocardiopsis alborubida]
MNRIPGAPDPCLRIVRGRPSVEETAALVAVSMLLERNASRRSEEAPPGPVPWNRPRDLSALSWQAR